jgi:hypothetical protein
MRRLPELVQDVVARVDDVIDRPRADRLEPPNHPLRARPNLYAANHHTHEPAHEIRLGNTHVDARRLRCIRRRDGSRRLRRKSFDSRKREGLPRDRRELACDPEVREQVRTIRADVDDEALIADSHGAEKRRAWRHVDVQFENSLMIVAESQLARRAQHAVRDGAADFSLLQLQSAGQRDTTLRERIHLTGRDVCRAAHDIEQCAGARVDLRDMKVIRVGMRRFLDDTRDDDVREVRAQGHELIDRGHMRRDEVAKLRRRLLERDECLQPFIRGIHRSPADPAICSKKRMSES